MYHFVLSHVSEGTDSIARSYKFTHVPPPTSPTGIETEAG